MEETKFHLTMANFLSVTLLLYYLGGFFIFLFMNSSTPYVMPVHGGANGPHPFKLYTSQDLSLDECANLNKKFGTHFDCKKFSESTLDFSFLDTVSESSKQDCTRINKRYGMSFDCETTPWSQLRVPYDKLYFVEKMDVTLNNFFKSAASLVRRNFSTIDGISVLLVFLLFAPLAALGGLRLLWRLLRRMARGVRSEAPAKPYYKTVLGVFALVMLLLCAGVVISASLSRPGAVREAVPDAQVDVYGDTVRGLLN